MKAKAHLEIERDATGRSVVRVLRSAAPLKLMPARTNGSALVHLVNSAAAPLGGDELSLTVRVGPGACLTLTGIAATVALPGPGETSRSTVHLELAEGATVEYLPEPTVITTRARHESLLSASLAADAHLRTREILVLGRTGERPGLLDTMLNVTRAGHPILRQHLTIGDPTLDASAAYLAGKRVLATELSTSDTRATASGEWWSRTPLAAGGNLTTALADDAVTALRHLSTATQSTG